MGNNPQNDAPVHTGHVSVLLNEVVEYLCESLSRKENAVYIDCTLGLGGHTRAILENTPPQVQAVVMDTDEQNVLRAKENLAAYADRIRFFHANFSSIDDIIEHVGITGADALLADLGFASNQMDDPRRGMSFLADGPLDMRLDGSGETTASDIVNEMDEKSLADVIYQYGEERLSRRIAKAIVNARKDGRIETTTQLAELIYRVMPPAARHGRIHPATRTFQALRIAVNEELKSLETLLEKLPQAMNNGGRAAIISFHSLEDRRVKQAFAALAQADKVNILTKKPITATQREISDNPRSRSAKMRIAEFL